MANASVPSTANPSLGVASTGTTSDDHDGSSRSHPSPPPGRKMSSFIGDPPLARLDAVRRVGKSRKRPPVPPSMPWLACGAVELSGAWRASAADDELRRAGIGLDVDDSGWLDIAVPGHWRSHPELATSDGPILYRTRFELPAPAAGARRWVTFDGIFYQADVWLDGAYLGDPEGYFFPHSFDITALCRLGDDHVLAVEVTCNPERGTRGRRNITGLFQHSEAVDRAWNPGGPVAARARVRHRSRQARPVAGAVPRRRRDARPPPPGRPPGQRHRPDRPPAHDRRRRDRRRGRAPAGRRAPTRSSGRSTSTGPSCGGPGPSATSR